MSVRITFTKMQGLGNDFVLIDARHQAVTVDADSARRIADRRLGIGCDQLLILDASDDAGVAVRCRIFNADGGEVEHCGNGVRCVARYLLDRDSGLREPLIIQLPHQQVRVDRTTDGLLRVNMGVPDFEPARIPLRAAERAARYRLDLDGMSCEFGALSIGNPHAVLTVDKLDEAPVAELGARIERHELFPARVNVGFMQILDGHAIRLRVFERGVGETRACGTGACAAAVIGIQMERLNSPVSVALPGGALKIEWEGEGNPVWMTGPATSVFEGEITI